jgi:uncharacterized membrane protein YidH (DUF202 family)
MNLSFYVGLTFLSFFSVQYLGFLTTYESTRLPSWLLIFLIYFAFASLGYANWVGYHNQGRYTDRRLIVASFGVSVILAIVTTIAVAFGIYAGTSSN